MSNCEQQIVNLLTAEFQFRLASAVRLATTRQIQPLDLPLEWSHGSHEVSYDEIALTLDQADYAAFFLHKSATYLMALTIKDAIRAAVHDPKSSPDPNVRAAYQIARLIRNAFAHAPFTPIWSIDPDCRNKVFTVANIITLDTTGLDRTVFDWRHYGGPLAIFHLCRFVRFEILKDPQKPRKSKPVPKSIIVQQGDLILTTVDEIPPGATQYEVKILPDNGTGLSEGHDADVIDTE
jgi:hypothetical protein